MAIIKYASHKRPILDISGKFDSNTSDFWSYGHRFMSLVEITSLKFQFLHVHL